MTDKFDNERLLSLAKEGNEKAREQVITENMGLVKSIAKRFIGRGTDMDDLCQIGCIGLIKAADRFDSTYEVKFSTYAVPVIMGEIRKYLRDDGPVKVSRSTKELSTRAAVEKARLEAELGRSPTISELKDSLDVDMDKLLLALESAQNMQSLYEPAWQDSEEYLLDKIVLGQDDQDSVTDKIALKNAIGDLDKKEQVVAVMRYYRGKTQTQVAEMLGVSQVQVSRIEKRIKEKIRKAMT
ncbi:MAG: SigB/SigF/SigG family RNA polymerase sigma factor [Bacillota bacterium]|nr:SigB/SigF/SigG family RNA polymerase sigma factor [Bacillota bacterium]